MNTFITGIEDLVALVGSNWVIAACAAFVVMIFESAKPRPVEGEDEPRASALQRVAMIASLAVPFFYSFTPSAPSCSRINKRGRAVSATAASSSR